MKDEALLLIDDLRESVKRIGVKNTRDTLKNNQCVTDHIAIIDSVISVLLEGKEFTKNDIFRKHIRGDSVILRNTLFVLISKTSTITNKQICEYVKTVSCCTVRNAICYYNKLDKSNKFDKKIIDKVETILHKITNGKTN